MRAVDQIHSPTPEEIMEYLDGEGTAASRDVIAAHLAACAACRSVAAEQTAISEDVRGWTVAAAPASLEAPAAPRPRRWRPSPVLMSGLVAASLVLVIGAAIQRGRNAPGGLTARSRSAAATTVPESGSAFVLVPPAVGPAAAQQDQVSAKAPYAAAQLVARTPAVIRTARLHMVVKDFTQTRSAVEALIAQADGFIDQMTVTGDTSEARTLRGTLRVPSARMADTLTRLRAMGQVTEDTQGSQDVTDQIVDLDARLASARATEQRLTELLRNRTGRLSDVLEVERELTRVRLDIERLDAEKTNVTRRVSYATIDITIGEERKASLDGPLSLATRIRVAAADGLEAAIESAAWAVLFLLTVGPALLLWLLAAASLWIVSRRLRARISRGLSALR